jgi:hypothetical protein
MLPKNWNDITIEQYVAVYKTLSEDPKDAEAQLNLLVKRVCLLTNQEPDWVEENCTMQDLAKMQDFLKSDLPLKLITDFRFEGRRYKVDIDPTKYDAGRYMSVMNQLKDSKIENLHKVIFQVCREVDWKGKTIEIDLKELPERIESFKQLPLKVANPISVFFCALSESLTNDILQYSISQIQTATKDLQTEIDYLNGSAG